MLRVTLPFAALLFAAPLVAFGASAADYNLNQMLQKVAKDSSVGTPRAINEDIMDMGFTVQGKELVDHLAVQPSHAAQMRANPQTVYLQLGASVCRDPSFRKLMAQGAIMRYDFSEYKTKKPVATHRYTAQDCGM